MQLHIPIQYRLALQEIPISIRDMRRPPQDAEISATINQKKAVLHLQMKENSGPSKVKQSLLTDKCETEIQQSKVPGIEDHLELLERVPPGWAFPTQMILPTRQKGVKDYLMFFFVFF